ncbi:MAG TPA: phosphoribosylamine--glycine ligase, partial [bacterium]|nr:phosphoribosylamine--glycine ligase [bacterium]
MKILVVGGGGREHALCWKIAQSPAVTELHAFPGNAGIAEVARIPKLLDDLPETICDYAERMHIDLTVVGPEKYLALGIADRFAEAGLPLFGVTAAAARLESSKAFAKQIMKEAGIPTARYAAVRDLDTGLRLIRSTARYPLVLKADGLAEGKGVVIAEDPESAEKELRELMEGRFKEAGKEVIIEEFLSGEELSLLILTDGVSWRPFTFAQDHKRAGEGDTGPNTGGMGSYAPVSIGTASLTTRCEERIIKPLLATLAKHGIPYRGILYIGLMIVNGDPFVLEYNVRFGDPETEALLYLLEDDLVPYLRAVANGSLGSLPALSWHPGASATVVVASGGYPGSYRRGLPITGLDAVDPAVTVFHAGTARDPNGRLIAIGGRVLMVTARGDTLAEATARATDNAARISWDTSFFRRDIGHRDLR